MKNHCILCIILLLSSNLAFSAQQELKVQLGSNQFIYSTSISPDGKNILTSLEDNTLRLWDVSTKKEMRIFAGHSDIVEAMAFSPDGKTALSGSVDGITALWDLGTGKVLRSLNTGPVSSLAFSPDGNSFVVGNWGKRNGYLKLWSVGREDRFKYFTGVPDYDTVVAFSPDGDILVGSFGDATLHRVFTSENKIANIDKGSFLRKLSRIERRIRAIAVSRDGKMALVGGEEGPKGATKKEMEAVLYLCDAKTGAKIREFSGVSGCVERVALSPDGKLALSSASSEVILWDTDTGKAMRRFAGNSIIISVMFSPDGKKIITDMNGDDVSYIDVETGEESPTFRKAGVVGEVKVSPDGNRAYSGRAIWDIRAGEKIVDLSEYLPNSHSFSFINDGMNSFFVSGDGTAKILDTKSGRLIASIPIEPSLKNVAALSSDGKIAVSRGDGKAMLLWNTDDGKVRLRIDGHEGEMYCIAISPNGEIVASGGYGKIYLWNAKTGDSIGIIGIPSGDIRKSVRTLAFSRKGTKLIAGTEDLSLGMGMPADILVYDPSIPWPITIGRFIGHSLGVRASAFSSDEATFMSAGYDNTIRLWNTKNGREIKRIETNTHDLGSVSFSSDGKSAVSGSSDGTMRVWNLITGGYTAFVDSADGSQWLVYTDDGYWDGSIGCSSLVAMVNGMECWNIDQFAIRNNRPDIIAKRLGASPEVVGELASAWRKRLRRLGMTESEISPDFKVPRGEIISAAQENDNGTGKYVDLRFAFSANGRPLARYQVYSNDVPLFGALGKTIRGDHFEAKERIELVAGENKIEVSCIDSGGSESLRVPRYFAWRGDVSPNLYYLAFGVSKYSDPAIKDLLYAAKDAGDLATAFGSMAGNGINRVISKVFTDDQVTVSAISRAKEFLKDARPDDIFVLFISGHGLQMKDASGSVPESSGKERDIGESGGTQDYNYYFITADSRLSDIPHTAAEFDSIEDILQGVAPRQKLFLMDTCESGEADAIDRYSGAYSSGDRGIYARALATDSMKGLSILPSGSGDSSSRRKDRYVYNDLIRRSGTIVFSSCLGNEASLEADEWQQGAFTAAILRALRDMATDKNNDGKISTDELRSYVISEVPRLVKKVDPAAQQHPTVDRDNIYAHFSFPIAR